MPEFTGHQKAMAHPAMGGTVNIGVGSVHGDDRSDRAILETKAFTLRYDHNVDDIGLINSDKS